MKSYWALFIIISLTVITGALSVYFFVRNISPDGNVPSPTPTTSATIEFSPTPTVTVSTQPSPTSTLTPVPSPTPSGTQTPASTPTPSPSPSVSPSPTVPVTPSVSTYTVVKGDTLSAIARKYGMTLAALEALNPQITNPNLIYPGQVINVKGTAAAAAAAAPSPSTPSSTPAPANQPTQASVIYRIQTTKPVVFLTIDDGIYKEPNAAKLLQENNLVASFFLTYSLIKDNPSYFADLSKATGSQIEAHTYSHQNLVTLTYAEQKTEIEKGLNSLQNTYGRRPVLFRPPYGNFNTNTRNAASALGLKTLVLWSVTVDQGKVEYASGSHLRPGDIVLMHFRPAFAQDIQAFATEMKAQGLHTELLENWIAK